VKSLFHVGFFAVRDTHHERAIIEERLGPRLKLLLGIGLADELPAKAGAVHVEIGLDATVVGGDQSGDVALLVDGDVDHLIDHVVYRWRDRLQELAEFGRVEMVCEQVRIERHPVVPDVERHRAEVLLRK
jgi:hypothetical protein